MKIYTCGCRITVLLVVLFLLLALPAAAVADNMCDIIDNAGLLDSSGASMLYSQAEAVSEYHNITILVLTVNSTEGMDIRQYSEWFYEKHIPFDSDGYPPGLLLVVNMDPAAREFYMTPFDGAQYVFTVSRLDIIRDNMLPDMKAGNYYAAFSAFINGIDFVMEDYSSLPEDHEDNPSNWGNYYETPDYHYGYDTATEYGLAQIIGGSIVIGVVVAGVVIGIMLALHNKSMAKMPATKYASSALALSRQSDVFHSTHTSRTRRPENDNHGHIGGGGGGGHSSGGGGGGGHSSGGGSGSSF